MTFRFLFYFADLILGEKIALAIAHSYVMTGFIPPTQDLLAFFSSTACVGGSSGSTSNSSSSSLLSSSISPSSAAVVDETGAVFRDSSASLKLVSSQVVSVVNQSFHSLTNRRRTRGVLN